MDCIIGLPLVGIGGFIGALGIGRDPAGPPIPEKAGRAPVCAFDVGCAGRGCWIGGTKFGCGCGIGGAIMGAVAVIGADGVGFIFDCGAGMDGLIG